METMSPTRKIWVCETGAVEKRDLWSSLKRGFRGRCPRCGKGKLFRGFLKVDNRCSVCGLDFHAAPHRRSAGLSRHRWSYRGSDCASDRNGLLAPSGAATSDLLPLTVAFSLALLQPVKGAVVGLQWALRMHGFDNNAPEAVPPA
jgi:uncharacterized protein (DUF983 family)